MAKRKVGRPAGSQTKDLKTFDEIPVPCQACECTDMIALNSISKSIAGDKNGQRYDEVVWQRKSCKACGNVQNHKRFKFAGREVHNEPAIRKT